MGVSVRKYAMMVLSNPWVIFDVCPRAFPLLCNRFDASQNLLAPLSFWIWISSVGASRNAAAALVSKADSLKEAIGWLKLMFGLLVAIDISLVAWLAQNYARAQSILLIMGWAAIIATSAAIVWVCAAAYRRINELQDV